MSNSKFKNMTELETVEHQLALFTAIASLVEDFARKHFCLKLSYDPNDKQLLKEAYINFLKNPTERLEVISYTMKYTICHLIPSLDSFEEVIDRLLDIYFWHRKLALNSEFSSFIDNQDKEALQTILKEAPLKEKYDEGLMSLFIDNF